MNFHKSGVDMEKPTKRIVNEDTMNFFVSSSPSLSLIIRFVERICLAIKGCVSQEATTSDPVISKLVSLVGRIGTIVDETPPMVQSMRFGNKSFRVFHESLSTRSDELLTEAGIDDPELRCQLSPYLLDSFGNPIRIDYGTGHEVAFVAFLFILIESGTMPWNVSVFTVLFPKYIQLVRKVTTQYSMEPAGSHGVWGLDDYHFLPFLFGAAQLIGQEDDMYRPRDIVQRLSPYSSPQPFMMFEYCLSHILKTKCQHAPFAEVSPILHDLLKRLDNWTLVCYGLMQMYKAEVLHKKPVMQHFYFSHYLPWDRPQDS